MKISITNLPKAIDFINNANRFISEKYGDKPMGIMVFSPVGIGKTQQIEGIVKDVTSSLYNMPFHYVPVGQMSIDELSFVPDVNKVENGRCGRAYLTPDWTDQPSVILMDECDRCQNPTVLDQAVSWAMDRQHPYSPAKGSVVILCGNGVYDDNTIEIDKRIRTRCCILDVVSSRKEFCGYMKSRGISSEMFGATIENYGLDEVGNGDDDADCVEQIRTSRTYMWAIYTIMYFYSSSEVQKRYEDVLIPVIAGLIRKDAAISLINDVKMCAMKVPSSIDDITDSTEKVEDPMILTQWVDREMSRLFNGEKNVDDKKLYKFTGYVKKCNSEIYRNLKVRLLAMGYRVSDDKVSVDKKVKSGNRKFNFDDVSVGSSIYSRVVLNYITGKKPMLKKHYYTSNEFMAGVSLNPYSTNPDVCLFRLYDGDCQKFNEFDNTWIKYAPGSAYDQMVQSRGFIRVSVEGE